MTNISQDRLINLAAAYATQSIEVNKLNTSCTSKDGKQWKVVVKSFDDANCPFSIDAPPEKRSILDTLAHCVGHLLRKFGIMKRYDLSTQLAALDAQVQKSWGIKKVEVLSETPSLQESRILIDKSTMEQIAQLDDKAKQNLQNFIIFIDAIVASKCRTLKPKDKIALQEHQRTFDAIKSALVVQPTPFTFNPETMSELGGSLYPEIASTSQPQSPQPVAQDQTNVNDLSNSPYLQLGQHQGSTTPTTGSINQKSQHNIDSSSFDISFDASKDEMEQL